MVFIYIFQLELWMVSQSLYFHVFSSLYGQPFELLIFIKSVLGIVKIFIETKEKRLSNLILSFGGLTVACLDLALCSDSNTNIPLVVSGTSTHVTIYNNTAVGTYSAAKLDLVLVIGILDPGPWFNINMLSYSIGNSIVEIRRS